MWKYLIVLLLWSGNATAQKSSDEIWVLPSPWLSQPDSVFVIRPDNYNGTSQKYPVVYLLHGYTGSFRQWPRVTDCRYLANLYQAVIICPDAFSSWYISSPYDSGSRMEDFFFRTLVPYVHSHVAVDTANIFISGLSMGGYGALRYFLRHPGYFNTAASTSGALTTDYALLKKVWSTDRMLKDITRYMGNPKTEWEQHGIPYLLTHAKEKPKPFLLDCGTEDVLLPATLRVKKVCDSLKIPVTMTLQPGNHSRAYWKKSIAQHFLFFKESMR